MREGVLVLALGVALAGCAHLEAIKVGARVPRDQPCAAFLKALHEIVMEQDVSDAATAEVLVFPYLRVNRFYEALGKQVRSDDQREQWLNGLRQLFFDSVRKEIRNLPEPVHALASENPLAGMDKDALVEAVRVCSEVLLESDRALADYPALVTSVARVPDEYSTVMRIVGLHPLVSLPVTAVTDRVRRKTRRIFAQNVDRLPVFGTLTAYGPAPWAKRSPADIEELIRVSSRNPLRVPILGPGEQRVLAEAFAPVFWVDVVESRDQPGAVVASGSGFGVDRSRPTLYYYLSHAFLGEQPITQVNYVIWFPERGGALAPRIEWGCLDGLTVRLSLTPEGHPFMMDVMNNCGCYHFFVPKRDAIERVRTKRFGLDPFVPQWLPSPSPSGRFALRVNSGWHQVDRVLAAGEPGEGMIPYELRPYEDLESMEGSNGVRVSLFSGRGVAKGTGRVEPLIFFSMGIPLVGSMRQRGHHAIDLVGRSHFDDPHLFNRHFVFK